MITATKTERKQIMDKVGTWKRQAGIKLADQYMATANDISGDEEVTIPGTWEGRMEMIAAGVLGVEKSQLMIQGCAAIADSVQIARYLETLCEEDEREARSVDAIDRLVDHLYEDQHRDINRAAANGEDTSGHIFRAVYEARGWLRRNYYSFSHYVDVAIRFYARLCKDPDDGEAKWELLQCGRIADAAE